MSIRPLLILLVLLLLAGCERMPPSMRLGPPPAYSLQLAAADTPNTVTRRLLAGADVDALVAISPDGRTLAHSQWLTGDLAVRDLVTGHVQPVTRNVAPYVPGLVFFPRFSPDGELIAAVEIDFVNVSGPLRIYRADGSGEPRTVQEAGRGEWFFPVAWTPDNAAVIVVHETDSAGPGTDKLRLAVAPVAGGALRPLRKLHGHPIRTAVSPDGRFIAFDAPLSADGTGREIYIMPLAGGQDVAVTRQPAQNYVVGWLPGDGGLLIATDAGGTPSVWRHAVRNGRPDGPPTLVKPDFFRASPVDMTADGRLIYAVETGNFNVYEVPYDTSSGRVTGEPTPILPRADRIGSVAWSRDGRSIAYTQPSGPISQLSRPHVMVRSLESGEERRLPLPAFNAIQDVRWNADGGGLLFLGNAAASRALFSFDLRTGQLDTLFVSPRGTMLHRATLRSDGSFLVEESVRTDPGRRQRLAIRDPATGAERELFAMEAADERGARFSGGALTRDEAWLALVLHAAATEGEVPDRLVLRRVADGATRELATGHIGSVVFSPDQRYLLYTNSPSPTQNEPAVVMRVPVDGGAPEPVGVSLHGIGRLAFRGDWLVFTGGTSSTEIWTMEVPQR